MNYSNFDNEEIKMSNITAISLMAEAMSESIDFNTLHKKSIDELEKIRDLYVIKYNKSLI